MGQLPAQERTLPRRVTPPGSNGMDAPTLKRHQRAKVEVSPTT